MLREFMIKNILQIVIVSLLFGVAIFASQDNISWRRAFIKEVPKPLFTKKQIETISLADTIMLHQNDRNIFLDVRAKRYYDYAHIPGAINQSSSNRQKQSQVERSEKSYKI